MLAESRTRLPFRKYDTPTAIITLGFKYGELSILRRRVIAELPGAAAEIQTTQRINTEFQRWEHIALEPPDRRATKSCQKLEGASNSNRDCSC